VREYHDLFGEAFWAYDTFAFVRNPYARLVSAYEYLRRGGHPAWPEDRRFGKQVLGVYDGFREFVLEWLQPSKTEWPVYHFYPQTHFLTLDGDLAVDFLGHVETIEDDFSTLCDFLGETAELSKRNATSGTRAPVAAYYESDAVVRRVQEVYRSDFERFGYVRDVESAEAPPRS
jgi:Sulfotransferase family.